jgi:hypothetical protein
MDDWERQMSTSWRADEVQLSHQSISRTVNGNLIGGETFVELLIVNSEALEEVVGNQTLYDRKCKEIKDSVLRLPAVDELPAFNDIRLRIVKKSCVPFIRPEKETIKSYSVH